MKRYLVVPLALLAFILFSARSCVEEHESEWLTPEEAYAGAMDSVQDLFGAESLDEASLVAFTEKAKQKLADWADLMNMAADTSLDTAFRTQAWDMVDVLFSPGVMHPVPDPGIRIHVDSIRITEPLQASGRETYTGLLGFTEKRSGLSLQGLDETFSRERTAEIWAGKSITVIGSDTLEIWKVYLGELH